ncbi:hypothetical protein E2C01_011631 [Portunus trituberculatus]|uniref:Uncharacterized protein n=1 Tax=Portunus trituberculatus TaxID=210409 RepID=A0A5B7DBY5_PORTR|nr:hypothetical protein [Portunus trituberculatus]
MSIKSSNYKPKVKVKMCPSTEGVNIAAVFFVK